MKSSLARESIIFIFISANCPSVYAQCHSLSPAPSAAESNEKGPGETREASERATASGELLKGELRCAANENSQKVKLH